MSQRSPQSGEYRWPDTKVRPRTFFGAPRVEDLEQLKADIAFIGVPFDQATNWRPGARFGPNALRDAPVYFNYTGWWDAPPREAAGYFEVETGREMLKGVTMADLGDINTIPAEVEVNFDRLTRVVRRILEKGAFPVVIGGDHSVTFPAVRGFDRYQALDIIHFDAHLDYTHNYQGNLYNHGSPIRRCSELPFVRNISSVGIRAVTRQPYEDAMARGNLVITADQARAWGPGEVARRIPKGNPTYITIDIDVLDPSHAPGTGAPAPGGLTYLELRDILREVVKGRQVVGLDMVEVSPMDDWNSITALNAARLVLDVLSALFPSRG